MERGNEVRFLSKAACHIGDFFDVGVTAIVGESRHSRIDRPVASRIGDFKIEMRRDIKNREA